MELLYHEIDFEKGTVTPQQTSKAQFLELQLITNRDYWTFLAQTSYLDFRDDCMLLVVEQQLCVVATCTHAYVILSVEGGLSFNLGESLGRAVLEAQGHGGDGMSRAFDAAFLLVTDNHQQRLNDLLRANMGGPQARAPDGAFGSFYERVEQQQTQVATLVHMLTTGLQSDHDEVPADLLEVHLQTMINIQYELQELVQMTNVTIINQRMQLNYTRNQILKSTLITNCLLVSIAICNSTFGFFGMNLTSGLEENSFAFYVIFILTLLTAASFFAFLWLRVKKLIKTVYS